MIRATRKVKADMIRFRDIKIKYKLIVIVMLICIGALVITGSALTAWMHYTVRESMI